MLHFKYALKTDGATQVLLDLCAHMDPDKVFCDFLLGAEKIPPHIQGQIRMIWPEGSRGGQIYPIETYCRERDLFRYTLHKIVFCCRLMREGHYDVVHVHTEDASRSLILLFAWMMGVKGRVVHSHNSFTQSGRWGALRQAFFKQLLPFWANGYLACSAQAARWMFPARLLRRKRAVFLPNGIRTEMFRFSQQERLDCRRELGLAGEPVFLLCAVGRLARQKNLGFLLQVLTEAERQRARSGDLPVFRLLLVGDGPEREALETAAGELGLSGQVLFLGERDDVPRLLWAADLFLLPSFFEGLPRALVEAQAAGLPCIVSDRVTRQADLTGRVCYLPAEGSVRRWAEKILEEMRRWTEEAREGSDTAERRRAQLRSQANLKVQRSGFGIRDGAKKLERYYDRFQKSRL